MTVPPLSRRPPGRNQKMLMQAPAIMMPCRASRSLCLRLRSRVLFVVVVGLIAAAIVCCGAVVEGCRDVNGICFLIALPAVFAAMAAFPKSKGWVRIRAAAVEVAVQSSSQDDPPAFAIRQALGTVSWETIAVVAGEEQEHLAIALYLPGSCGGVRYTTRIVCGFDRADFERLYVFLQHSGVPEGAVAPDPPIQSQTAPAGQPPGGCRSCSPR